jgi:hypothetical protein
MKPHSQERTLPRRWTGAKISWQLAVLDVNNAVSSTGRLFGLRVSPGRAAEPPTSLEGRAEAKCSVELS